MPRIHVCSLALVPETVAASGASHLVTLVDSGTPVPRPRAIRPERHLRLGVNDIAEPVKGQTLPSRDHVLRLLTFVKAWDRAQPMVVHCYAGISRSTAAAYIALCALSPERNEAEIARSLRLASPSAFPNRRLIAIGDSLLARDGRMIAAVEAIGEPTTADGAIPFHLPLAL